MNIKLNHIQHIGIPVTDIKASEAFYEKLGFKNVMPAVFEYKGGKGIVSMMQLTNMIIELYQLPEIALEEIRNRRDGYIDHIAFDVDDIEEMFNTLKEEGFNIQEEAPVFLSFWEKGCKYFNIIGPGGERVEFNQIIK
jgi:catechol 2,3-dioxygenase-like lactoylglutathione lyase family enzyme